MEADDNITEEDIKNYKQAEIVRASINCIKERAQKQDHIRHSPQNYRHVKSRVAKNIKTLDKVNKAQKKAHKPMPDK